MAITSPNPITELSAKGPLPKIGVTSIPPRNHVCKVSHARSEDLELLDVHRGSSTSSLGQVLRRSVRGPSLEINIHNRRQVSPLTHSASGLSLCASPRRASLPKRAGLNRDRSIEGFPSRIHSATMRPVMGECWKPWPPKPTARKKPSTPGA